MLSSFLFQFIFATGRTFDLFLPTLQRHFTLNFAFINFEMADCFFRSLHRTGLII